MKGDEVTFGRKVWVVRLNDGRYFRPGADPVELLNNAQLYSEQMARFLAGEHHQAIVPCRQVVVTDKDARLLLEDLTGTRQVWAITLKDGYYFRSGMEPTRVLGEAQLFDKEGATNLAAGVQGEAVLCREVVLTEQDAKSRLPLDRPPAAKESIAAAAVEEAPVKTPATTTTRRRRS